MGLNPWSTGEVARLRKFATLGLAAAAYELGRTPAAVRHQAARQGISLRQPGERRGKLLGEPRAGSLGPRERTAILVSGTNEVAARLARATDLCPACGYRSAGPTGVCETCRLRALAQGHREAIYAQEAGRELAAVRQQKHRLQLR